MYIVDSTLQGTLAGWGTHQPGAIPPVPLTVLCCTCTNQVRFLHSLFQRCIVPFCNLGIASSS